MNTPGSFECPCSKGYTLDYDYCKDIDECATGSHECDKNAACSNLEGDYVCTCNGPLFHGNGFDCYYHDTCWNSPCGDYSTCQVDIDAPGRYRKVVSFFQVFSLVDRFAWHFLT